jgi:O-antigen ligase
MRKVFFRQDLFKKRLFQLLVFLLPTQLAYHFWPDFSLIFGIRVDYLAPAVYLTDVLILLLILLSLNRKSIIGFVKKHWLIVLILLLFTVGNIYFARGREVALIKWLKIGELVLFSILVSKERNFNIQTWVIKPLLYSSILFSLIGVVQFFLGRTIGGIFYLLGERSFNLNLPGIALVKLNGTNFLRAYSTFSHPNSLAGYFAAILFLVFQSKERKAFKALAIGLVLFVVVLSFSRAAIAALLLVGLAGFLPSMFKKKLNLRKFALMVFGITLIGSLLLPVVSDKAILKNIDYSDRVSERLILNQVSGKMFVSSPFLGVGLNNFIVNLPEYVTKPDVNWLLQPVHNTYLLLLTETGMFGLIIFSFLLIQILKNNRYQYLYYSLLIILITGLLDHYWLTLQQNQLLFTLIWGLSLRKSAD